jgi:hypothetical protein
MNLGRNSNWGHEALVRASVIDRSTFKLDFTVNGSWNSNRLDTLGYDPNGNPIPDILTGFNSTQIIRTGQPLGAYYQKDFSYSDKNGDGLISCPTGLGSAACEVTVSSAASYLGSPFPAAEIAFSPAVSIGSYFRVSATVDHRGAQKLFNLTQYYRDLSFQNSSVAQTPEATSLQQQAAAIAASYGGTYAGYIQDASFTKLREVAVTLTLPKHLAARANASGATLTLAGRNLKTWTNYTGLDPELNAAAQSNLSTADFLTAPQVRYFTARLAFTF